MEKTVIFLGLSEALNILLASAIILSFIICLQGMVFEPLCILAFSMQRIYALSLPALFNFEINH